MQAVGALGVYTGANLPSMWRVELIFRDQSDGKWDGDWVGERNLQKHRWLVFQPSAGELANRRI